MDNRCVCCGEIIPEGRRVCPNCMEIHHPSRYSSGQFECIDVMLDVYGKQAVKHFCILNAFKYIWRTEKKNGVEDIKKAIWYLNKYIELGGDEE